uniref:NADH-ubiquinone oxidoreductase chain 6 n=1 Tax=Notonecta montandoni TaxID=2707887 RepID=A0A6C0R387_9HEMI|nr:NADH dehydrogenase subunit 6 [Notonecta montandoni]QHZ87290.1 NADH dehydrogenase subunit 6 [Notonecta montandoni]
MMLFLCFMLTMSLVFPWLKHPLSMGLILILQTMTVSIISGMMINSFWFSYILFIILLGGALVLFIYMASIASNEKFYFSYKMFMFTSTMMMVSIILFLLVDSMLINKIKIESKNIFLENEQMMSLIKLFNTQTTSLTIMLVMYLLITMIAITFIVNIYEGPMRSKN